MKNTLAQNPQHLTAISRPAPVGRPLSLVQVTPAPVPGPYTVADLLVEQLHALGVRYSFGICGGGIAPTWSAMLRSPIQTMHFRHEAGAAFAAMESYFASGHPAVVFATTGPGITNTITGLMEARSQGAKVILVSGYTPSERQGHGVFQETCARTLPAGLFTSGPVFHYAVGVERPEQMPEVLQQLAAGLARPDGFIAHVSVSPAVQTTRVEKMEAPKEVSTADATPAVDPELVQRCAKLLAGGPFAIWVGFGARHAGEAIRTLAERCNAPIMCSPRAKGVVPENHPLYVGVTGHGGHASVFKYMKQHKPSRVLVLGTRLSEFTCFANPHMVPSEGFIHVDLDPTVPGSVYTSVPTVGVQAEVGAFLAALLEAMPQRAPVAARMLLPRAERFEVGEQVGSGVRPEYLMNVIQKLVVEGSDVPVMAEVGSALAWCTHGLRFNTPGRFRLSTAFAAMGHGSTGVLGAAVARKGKAVVVAGDGAMLMNNEISTAVRYNIPAVWIVLNDSCYGMVDQGMAMQRLGERDTDIPSTDFALIARGMGASGRRVTDEAELVTAIKVAMASPRPFVVDVVVDRTRKAPLGARIQSLIEQGAHGTR